jgi:hypothetical protein
MLSNMSKPEMMLGRDEGWCENEVATRFAQELRTSEFENIPETKMQILSFRSCDWFKKYDSIQTDESFHLVMRAHALDVWNHILSMENTDPSKCNFAVIGSPGIGKSFGLYYLLKRLLERNEIVVLDKKKSVATFAFFPIEETDGSVRYKVYRTHALYSRPAAMLHDFQNIWYLIDPPKAENWTGPYDVAAKTVLAASPDIRHLGEWRKNQSLTRLYMKSWNLDELHACGKFLCKNEDILRKLDERFYNVGGIIRHLFDQEQFLIALKQQKAVDLKTIESAVLLDLFEEVQHKEKLSSALFTFAPIETNEDWEKHHLDPPFKKFTQYTVDFVSNHAADMAGKKILGRLMHSVEFRNAEDGSSIGHKYEKCAIIQIEKGGSFRAMKLVEDCSAKMVEMNSDIAHTRKFTRKFRMPPMKQSFQLDLPLRRSRLYANSWKSFFDLSKQLKDVDVDEKNFFSQESRNIIVPQISNLPSVDFSDASNRFFQATISSKKTFNLTDHLSNRITNDLIRGQKLYIFFVIPWFEYRKDFEVAVHSENEEILGRIEFYNVEVPNATKSSKEKENPRKKSII